MYGEEFVEVSILYGAKIRSALAYWNATITSEISEAKCHLENLPVFWKKVFSVVGDKSLGITSGKFVK